MEINSRSEHNAPYNLDELENEDGELVWVCSCSHCQRKKYQDARDERKIADWEDRRERHGM